MNLFRDIKTKYYPYLEVVKALTLIGFFYFSLRYVEKSFFAPIYPKSLLESLFLYSFAGFLFLSWLLGERKKTLLVFAYFITFQIIGLAIILRDPWVIPRILIPTLLTYLSLFLFKSPEEFKREKQMIQMEKLKREVILLNEKLALYKEHLEQLKAGYKLLKEEKRHLEELYNSTKSEELKRLLEQKEEELKKSKKQIEELTKKIENLKENNRELWQLLEVYAQEDTPKRGKEELKKLRKERKKLLKQISDLEKLIKNLKEEKELLLLENKDLTDKLSKSEKEIASLKEEIGEKENRLKDLERTLQKGVLDYLLLLLDRVELKPTALEDFENLSNRTKESFIKYLKKLERMKPSTTKFESLESPNKVIFKDRFSGGRVYLTLKDGKFVIEGILEGEDEKTKDRFIRKRFS